MEQNIYRFGRGHKRVLVRWSMSSRYQNCCVFDIFYGQAQQTAVNEASSHMKIDSIEFEKKLQNARHDRPVRIK